MKNSHDKSEAEILRQKAEEALKMNPINLSPHYDADMLKLIHELEVHQFELEMQNEELLMAKEDAAKVATDKYAELYDFAPTGYFTLSTEGKILELNLSASQMLGKERAHLINSRIGFFVSDETRPIFNSFLDKVFNNKVKTYCEVALTSASNIPIYVYLAGVAAENSEHCLVNIVDITERKLAEQDLIIANKELLFQNEEKAKRAAELTIANEELLFQNEEKAKRAAELIIANKEIVIQTELNIANAEKVKLAALHQEALHRLEKIASRLPGMVYQFRLNPDGKYCFPFASKAINEIYRVTSDEAIEDASSVFAKIHSDDYAGFVASMRASAQNLTPWQEEYRVKFDDGTIRSLYCNAVPQREKDGSALWHGFITDITDRLAAEQAVRQADEALRENNLKIDIAMNVAKMAWWEMDITTGNVSCDKRKADMLGYPHEMFNHYQDFVNLVHPEDYEKAMDAMRGHFTGVFDKYEVEYRILTSSGEYKWFYDIGSIVNKDSDGKPLYIRGMVLDISERKITEEALQKSETLVHTLIHSIPDLICMKDTKGLYISCNTMFERFLGAKEAEIVGKTDYDFVNKQLADFLHKQDEDAMAAGKPTSMEEWITFADDGHNACLETIKAPIYDSHGTLIGVLGIGRDITELRKAEKEKLDVSESRYRSIFQGSTDGIIIADPETKMIMFANPAQCQMLGYTEDELKKMSISAIHPEISYAQTLNEFEKQARGQKNIPDNIQCLKKNGEIFYVDITSGFIDLNGKRQVVGFFRDITKRKQSEDELREALVKAESGNRLKTAFMQNISHEVRTPLNGILGFGSLLAEPDLTEEDKQQFIALLQASSNRLVNTITDYMDISLILSENIKTSPNSVNLMKALTEIKNKYQKLADIKKLTFNLIIPEENEDFAFRLILNYSEK
ncbi:MAG: PAS domain S-box protein [Bacteroidetes bacterium]|nr:PAS domain S-box protein [Bacteroidota bacterium]